MKNEPAELFKQDETVKEAFKAFDIPNMAVLYKHAARHEGMLTLGGKKLPAKYYNVAHKFKVLAHRIFPTHGCEHPGEQLHMAKATNFILGYGEYVKNVAEALNMMAVITSQEHFDKHDCKMLDELAGELLEKLTEKATEAAEPVAA